jgi:hypothetical protein
MKQIYYISDLLGIEYVDPDNNFTYNKQYAKRFYSYLSAMTYKIKHSLELNLMRKLKVTNI